MGNVLIDESILQGWADVVREKQGIDDLMKPSVLLEKTRDIGQGGSGYDLLISVIERTAEIFIDDKLSIIGNRAFQEFDTLKYVELKKATETKPNSFYNCKNLETFIAPELVLMGAYTLQTCPNLSRVECPKVEFISSAAFENTSLTTIDVSPSGIDNRAFRLCSKLTTVIMRSTKIVSLINITAFTSTPIESGTGYIYVPQALIEDYKVATNWTTYANQFRAIEDYPEICGGVSK